MTGLTGQVWREHDKQFVGPKKAKEMDFIAGSEMSGLEAQMWGFANHAVPEAELEQRARRMAMLIARTPPEH